jgi:beta-lactamase superfamily II metal-dependent hydrolase
MTSNKCEVVVLDVGHGNCGLVMNGDTTIVVDAPTGIELLNALKSRGVRRVRLALISHADDDHLGGMGALLTSPDVEVEEVRLNPDATKTTRAFEVFRIAAADASSRLSRQGATAVRTELTTAVTDELTLGDVRLEVLHPDPIVAVSGPGGRALGGASITSNRSCAVVRVLIGDDPVVLLASDMDAWALEHITSSGRGASLASRVLVFPHHGGHPGGSVEAFASSLTQMVDPEVVIFSIERGGLRNPRAEIVRGVLAAKPTVRILCTQLSSRCATEDAAGMYSHLSSWPSRGRLRGRACAGSVVLHLRDGTLVVSPEREGHSEFIRKFAPTHLCVVPAQARHK